MNFIAVRRLLMVAICGASVFGTNVAGLHGAAAQELIGQGTFTGKSRHVASGTVNVAKSGSGTVVTLGNDFSFDGAPDPKLGFGRNGYDPKAKFSKLRSNKGEQVYEVPADIEPGKYNEVWIWCEKYDVPLGVATIGK